MTRLLIVEDDPELCEALCALLRQSGYEVFACKDGSAALEALLHERFDLAIVDWMLPGLSGLELVRRVRQQTQTLPILIVTAREALADRVMGLDSGADDYLIKPFQMRELEARVRALLRRSAADPAPHPIRFGPMTLLPGEPRIYLEGTPVDVPASEFILLETLAWAKDRVVSRDVIAGRLGRRGEVPSETAIEICVHRLRRRLAPFGLNIRALRGFGYVLETLPK